MVCTRHKKRILAAAFSVLLATVIAGCAFFNDSYTQTPEKSKQQGLPSIGFSFDYSGDLKVIRRETGSKYYVDLVEEKNGKFIEEVTVQYLPSRATKEDPFNYLPFLISSTTKLSEREIPGFELVQEGPARMNGLIVYQLFFKSSGLPEGTYYHNKTIDSNEIFGRRVIAPQGTKRGGVIVTYYTIMQGNVKQVIDTGLKDDAKKIVETFEFKN